MANLSQQKRERMLAFLDKIKEEHKDDDETLIALDEIENELNSKKYGLVWEKHEEEVDRMMQDNIPVFTEVKEREIKATDKNSYNFLLEGDNLHSLKLLEKTHAGKIDVIYIDPPYNTGNQDFIYDDTFIDKTDGYAHSKWLSFMSERLEIAKKLLSDDGVIFISIDDREQSNLHLLCDDIFGSNNFITSFIWEKTHHTGKQAKNCYCNVDYILAYANKLHGTDGKLKSLLVEKVLTEFLDAPLYNASNNEQTLAFPSGTVYFKNPIHINESTNKKYKLHNRIVFEKSDSALEINDVRYEYSNVEPIVMSFKSRWSQNEVDRQIEAGTKYVIKSSGCAIRAVYSDLKDGFNLSPWQIIKTGNNQQVGTNEDGSSLLKKLFGETIPFSYPKPISLVKYLVELCTNNKNTVLDFFAGSGTTAHAVLELNKEDGGNRKFILCTNNENDICEEITYERIKRVIHGYADVEGIPANLKYFKTDFIPKDTDDVSEELLSHIKEMVELENGITLDNKHYLIVLSDAQADELAKSWSNYDDVKAIYVSHNVLFTSEQNALFSNTDIHIIPDYYFEYELKEVGETW